MQKFKCWANIENLSKTIDGQVLFKDLNLTVNDKDKIAFLSENDLAITTLFEILNGNLEPDTGKFEWVLL